MNALHRDRTLRAVDRALIAEIERHDTVATRRKHRERIADALNAAGYGTAADRVRYSSHRNDWEWAVQIIFLAAMEKDG